MTHVDTYTAIRQTARHLLTLTGWADNKLAAQSDAGEVLDELCQDLIEISYQLDDIAAGQLTGGAR